VIGIGGQKNKRQKNHLRIFLSLIFPFTDNFRGPANDAVAFGGYVDRIWRMDNMVLTREALKLPPAERVQVIDSLWQSLDLAEQTAIDQAWLVESRDRLQAHHGGKLAAVDGEEALRQIEAGLRK
jgi:putative addiction module component (TIGR02574 family)